MADERSQKELMRACRKNRAGKVEKLLQEPQDPNGGGDNIPIHEAAMEGHLQVLQLLVEARADTNAARGRGETALDFAVERGHFHVLKFLVESGANPNSDHFFVAALCDSLEAVQLFLEAGADKNYANYAPENYIYSNKPLYMAAERGSLEMVRLLAEAGADIDAALTPKVASPPWVLMPTLMPACASVPHGNAVKGLTALHEAVSYGHSEVVRFL